MPWAFKEAVGLPTGRPCARGGVTTRGDASVDKEAVKVASTEGIELLAVLDESIAVK
jgi:hypothetical protein